VHVVYYAEIGAIIHYAHKYVHTDKSIANKHYYVLENRKQNVVKVKKIMEGAENLRGGG